VKVLVCTDFSAAAAAGEREAAKIFPGAELVLFHAVDPRVSQIVEHLTGKDRRELRDELMAYADQRLAEIVGRLTSKGTKVQLELVEGDPVESAIAVAARTGCGAMIVGVEPTEIGRFRTRLARRCPLPLVLVPS
jgi:nucleotide-binding universal stress UspA family protein